MDPEVHGKIKSESYCVNLLHDSEMVQSLVAQLGTRVGCCDIEAKPYVLTKIEK